MKDVGYQYVNLDDCWMDGRDSSGKLRWNATKFPAGIPALADYIHGKGLKIGIYEVPGRQDLREHLRRLSASGAWAASATRRPTRRRSRRGASTTSSTTSARRR